MSKQYIVYIIDILNAIDKIEKSTNNIDYEAFKMTTKKSIA
jgi:uncharacterized protein with HEPN domain